MERLPAIIGALDRARLRLQQEADATDDIATATYTEGDAGAIADAITLLTVQQGSWQPMETAPRDGTLLRLLVRFTEHPIDDAAHDTPLPTIGANSFDNTGEDEWQVVGWCWTHDHFTQGQGTPVGWLPMVANQLPAAVETEADRLRWALTEYPKRNTHQLQAAKVCVGVVALAGRSTERQR